MQTCFHQHHKYTSSIAVECARAQVAHIVLSLIFTQDLRSTIEPEIEVKTGEEVVAEQPKKMAKKTRKQIEGQNKLCICTHLPVILGCRLASDLVELMLLLDRRRRLYVERTGRGTSSVLPAASGDDDDESQPELAEISQ